MISGGGDDVLSYTSMGIVSEELDIDTGDGNDSVDFLNMFQAKVPSNPGSQDRTVEKEVFLTADLGNGADVLRAETRTDASSLDRLYVSWNVDLGDGDDVANGRFLGSPDRVPAAIPDGTTNTIMVGEFHTRTRRGRNAVQLEFTSLDIRDSNVSIEGGDGPDHLALQTRNGSVANSDFELRGAGDNDLLIAATHFDPILGADIHLVGTSIALLGEDGDDTIVVRQTGANDGSLLIDASGGAGSDTLGGLIVIPRGSTGSYNVRLSGDAGNDTGILAVLNESDAAVDSLFQVDGGDDRDRLYGNLGVDVVNGEFSIDRPLKELHELLKLIDAFFEEAGSR